MREGSGHTSCACRAGRALLACVLAAAVLAAAFPLVSGCSDLDNGSFGPSSGIVYPHVVSEPRPTIDVTTPARGAFLVPGAVAVEGVVHPARPGGPTPTAILVNGAPVAVDPDGSFRTLTQVAYGLNVIRATTADANGRTGFAAVGVLAGGYAPTTQRVQGALGFRLNDPGLSGATKVIEDFVASYDLASLSAQNIYSTRILGFASLDAFLDRISIGQVTVSLDAQTGGIAARVQVEAPQIDVSAIVNLGGGALPPEDASVICDRIVVTARARPEVDAQGKISLAIDAPTVDLVNMRTRSASPVITFVDNLLHDLVRAIVEDQVVKLIAQQKTALDPMAFELLPGKSIDVDIRGSRVTMDNGGLEVVCDVDCTPTGGVNNPRAVGAPGSLATPGAFPLMRAGNGLHIALNDDLLNRIAYSCWATGAGTIDLDAMNRAMAPTGTAVPPLMLAKDLKQVLPELNYAVPDGAPVNALVECVLPPVFRSAPFPDVLQLDIGELQATLVVDRGQGWEPVLKAAIHLSATVDVTIDHAGLHLSSASNPTVLFDVMEKPMVEIDDRRIEVAIGLVAMPALPYLLNRVVAPIPHVQSLTVFQVGAFPDGPGGDYCSILADLSR